MVGGGGVGVVVLCGCGVQSHFCVKSNLGFIRLSVYKNCAFNMKFDACSFYIVHAVYSMLAVLRIVHAVWCVVWCMQC